MTYDNPNVFYELALCHVAIKPFIQMIEKDKKIPFDTSHVRTINYALDVKSAEETKVRLAKLIQRNLDGETENPISLGLDALKLKESNAPLQQITAGIFDKLQSLENRLGSIQNLMVRQASQSPFHPNFEIFNYDEQGERIPERIKDTLQNFIRLYLAKFSEDELEHLYKKFFEGIDEKKDDEPKDKKE